ncbi:TPA: hypothetical protein J1487_004212 [Escherichia coli]|nr:hypothetical protein [Escherichia coli]HBA9841814.1 hypothetical protein [Escherichia coli]
MFNGFFLTTALFFLLKYTMRWRFITVLSYLVLFDFLFFFAIFGRGSWDIIKSSYAIAPFALSLIIDAQIILVYFLRSKGSGIAFLSSIIPPLLFTILDFNFIIPAHPLMMFYQYDAFYRFLPRFNVNLINIIIIYTIPFCFLLPSKKKIIIPIVFLYFFYWNISAEPTKLGIKVLIVQTGMFVSKHDRIIELKNEIFKYKDADIVVFSESPIIGFKDGSRTAFSRELLSEIKNKHDGKLYIVNSYGFVVGDKKYNNNLSLYIMNGKEFFRYKSKLVPFWETPGLFYRENGWESPYFSIQVNNKDEKYKFRNIYINSYVCYEAMFANSLNNSSDLTIIQSNYESFYKDYDRIVKNGNVLAYVNKSHGFKNFISVQNMGGTIFVDSSGRFHWDVYKISKEKPVFLLEI